MNAILSATTLSKAVGAGALFVLIFLTGLWLSHTGKPYGVLLFTIHKLIAVGAIAFLAVILYQANQVARLGGIELAAALVTGLLFLGTLISGGLLSTDLRLPAAILRVHQVAPFLTLLSTSGTLYLLLNRQ